jgi:hypothetical protein
MTIVVNLTRIENFVRDTMDEDNGEAETTE